MRLARHAWIFVVLTAALAAAQAALLRAGGVPLLSATAVGNGFPGITVATVVGALVGAVILSRRPRHPIGWLFCLGQLGVAAGLAARAAGDAALAGGLGFPEAGRTWEWIGDLLGSVFALMLLAVLLLLAPDGRLPSPRWRPALLLPPASYALLAVTLVALARPAEVGLSGQVPHASLVDPLVAASSTGVFAGLVAGAAAVVVRLVRARGEARQQMRWIAVASIGLAVVPVLAVAVNLTGRPTPLVLVLALHLAYLAVPVATGFAVLRYRLYDVDRVIGGAVVLTVLVVVASAGYLLAVAAVGRAAEDRGRPSWLALVAFVAVVLALQPVRRVAGRGADRLVYGPRAARYAVLVAHSEHLADAVGGRAFLTGVAQTTARLLAADLLPRRRPAGRRQRGERGLAARGARARPGCAGGPRPARRRRRRSAGARPPAAGRAVALPSAGAAGVLRAGRPGVPDHRTRGVAAGRRDPARRGGRAAGGVPAAPARGRGLRPATGRLRHPGRRGEWPAGGAGPAVGRRRRVRARSGGRRRASSTDASPPPPMPSSSCATSPGRSALRCSTNAACMPPSWRAAHRPEPPSTSARFRLPARAGRRTSRPAPTSAAPSSCAARAAGVRVLLAADPVGLVVSLTFEQGEGPAAPAARGRRGPRRRTRRKPRPGRARGPAHDPRSHGPLRLGPRPAEAPRVEGSLRQVAERPAGEHLLLDVDDGTAREDDDRGRARRRRQQARGGPAVDAGQLEVHEDQIRVQPRGEEDGLLTGPGDADDAEPGGGLDDRRRGQAEGRLVVDDQHCDLRHLPPHLAANASSRTRPSAAGPTDRERCGFLPATCGWHPRDPSAARSTLPAFARLGATHPRGAPVTISFTRLTKRYGAVTAVDDLSVDVQPGRITAFLGPNGSGKTTSMRAAARPGTVPTLGQRHHRRPALPRVAASEAGRRGRARPGLPPQPDGAQAPAHRRAQAGVPRARVEEMLELVGLDGGRRPPRRRLLPRHAPAPRPRRAL